MGHGEPPGPLGGIMAQRVYLVPIIGTGASIADARRAKYFKGTGASGRFIMMPYGLEPFGLVVAEVTQAQHNAIAANSDVQAFPANLDSTLSAGAVTTTKAGLESLSIPNGWVTTSLTFRNALRVVIQIFQFSQRFHGLGGGRMFPASVTLDTQFSALPAGRRASLISAAASFGWDTSGLSGTNTLRQILKAMADQWGNTAILVGEETF